MSGTATRWARQAGAGHDRAGAAIAIVVGHALLALFPAILHAGVADTLGHAPTEHVVLISVDGLRPDAITAETTPTLYRLGAEGARAAAARTVHPSTTVPAHTSMLTGRSPRSHGVDWNLDEVPFRGYSTFPTVFTAARSAGLTTAAFLGKTKLRYLTPPDVVGRTSLPDNPLGGELAAETVGKVVAALRDDAPNLLFVHLGDPDYAGHQFGWMSPRYLETVATLDAEIHRVLIAAEAAFGPGGYTVIVTADHGGQGHNHGSAEPRDVAIPWIAWGRAVRSGTVLERTITTMDTAPTVLRLLGLPPLPRSEGRLVEQAIRSGGTTRR